MSAVVGSDIEAVCRRCGTVWHRVIALAEGRIAKVECGECGARHRFRPPGGRVRSSPGARGTRARRQDAVVRGDPSRPPRSFDPKASYQVGDRVRHASFGEGVVQALKGASKVEVLFEAGLKTLVQGRAR